MTAPVRGRAIAVLADVVPAAVATLRRTADPLDLGPVTGVVVLVVDGLGAEQLADHADLAPWLVGRTVRVIDVHFPSTTVTSLASLGTATGPGVHGLVGYTLLLPDHDRPFNPLVWRVGLRGGGRDVRRELPPEAIQPLPTVYERAAAHGIRTTTVVHPDFLASGLTRAVLRGGRRVAATGLEQTLRAAVAAAAPGPGPALVYAHHPRLDTIGHADGPRSPEWRAELRRIDRTLAVVERWLPRGVALLVVADHGMLHVEDDDMFELQRDDLADGVDVLAGEPRVRYLRCRPGASDAVAGRWRRVLGDRATVVTRDEAIGAGWFGPTVTSAAAGRIGDLVVVARRGTLVHARVDPHGGRLRGMHGGATPEERRVPLVVARS